MSSKLIAAGQLGIAGIAFALYPLFRGYATEVGLEAAALYARPAWLVAHLLGMIGFALLAAGLVVVDARSARAATWGAIALLPYYGAEAFGLHALGVRIQQTGHVDMVEAAGMFRYQPVAMAIFATGLVLVAVVGVRLTMRGVQASGAARWGLLGAGVALATYLPQFFLPGPARIAHGVLLGLGLVIMAVTPRRQVQSGDYSRI